MSRKMLSCLIAAAIFAPAIRADVKKQEKTQIKFEGMMGRVMGMAGGNAAKDGVTSSVSVKGHRKATVSDQTGRIIDLSEEKVYDVDYKKKEYRVTTFAQLREQMKQAQAEAAKAAKDMPAAERGQPGPTGSSAEASVDVKETGETKMIAGHKTKQVIVTITLREKGKTLEEGGGMVLTTENWVGPRIAALDEVGQFDMKFIKAVYGDGMTTMGQQFVSMSAMYPGLDKLMAQSEEQMKKLAGTPLMTVQRTETVKTTEAMAQPPAAPASGGGLSGALARRMMGNKKPEQRNVLFTSTTETLSIETVATDADVAIPAGFKEKK